MSPSLSGIHTLSGIFRRLVTFPRSKSQHMQNWTHRIRLPSKLPQPGSHLYSARRGHDPWGPHGEEPGVLFDKHLTWDPHVSALVKRYNGILIELSHVRHQIPRGVCEEGESDWHWWRLRSNPCRWHLSGDRRRSSPTTAWRGRTGWCCRSDAAGSRVGPGRSQVRHGASAGHMWHALGFLSRWIAGILADNCWDLSCCLFCGRA